MHSKAPEIRQNLSLLETSEVYSDSLLETCFSMCLAANIYFYRTFLDTSPQQVIVQNGLCIALYILPDLNKSPPGSTRLAGSYDVLIGARASYSGAMTTTL